MIPETFDLKAANSVVLGNGVSCHYIHAGDQPVMKLELYFDGGRAADQGSFESFFVSKTLQEGTHKKTATQIAQYIEFHGAYFQVTSGNEKLIVSAFTLNKHLQKVLELLAELIQEASFGEADVNRIKNLQTKNLLVSQEKNAFLAAQTFKERLYPNHYYGDPLTSELIQNITPEGLKRFHQDWIKDKPFELFVCGHVNETDLKLIETHLCGLGSNGSPELSPELIPTQKTGTTHLDKPGSLQSSIRYGFQTLPKTHPDFFKFSFLNEILGGYFGSRLMSNIREDKGYTYGIGSYIIHMRDSSFLQISTDVKADASEHTIKEIELEINKLKTQEVGLEELTRVRNYLFGSFASSINTPFDLMDKFKSNYLIGLTNTYYDDYLSALKAITPQDLLETANLHFTDQSVIVTCH